MLDKSCARIEEKAREKEREEEERIIDERKERGKEKVDCDEQQTFLQYNTGTIHFDPSA